MEKNERENKNENKEKTIVENSTNNKKYIIPILVVVIVILIGGVCYLYMNSINKQKSIADKDKTIKKQQEELLNAAKDKEKDKGKQKEREKQTTKPNEQQKETKYLSKEEYLRIFKEYVGTDFPGIHTEKDPNGKKLEILEDVTEGLFDKCKYYLVKGNMIKSNNSGFAEGDYKVITRQQVRDRAHQFVRDMGYGKITEYRDNYDKSDPDGPSDLKVDLTAHNRDEKKLKLTIIFLRDKENRVTNKVYAAYVGIK